jgi:antirestriction protein ArdC
MNTFWLWMVADGCGYASPYWMTYRQCQALGGQVRKGEKSTIAIFYKSYTKEVENAEGEADTENRRVLKAYAVFNADQCDGLPAFYHPKPISATLEPEGREDRLDAFFAHIGADLRHHGAQAYYEPLRDRVTMPPAELFEAYDHYYATLAHELSHWTGHSSLRERRLCRRGTDRRTVLSHSWGRTGSSGHPPRPSRQLHRVLAQDPQIGRARDPHRSGQGRGSGQPVARTWRSPIV